MPLQFAPGDNLVFQLESGYGLLRVIAVDNQETNAPVWHIVVFEELFPDVESAEAALATPGALHPRRDHLALTDRALEKTPAARLSNTPVAESELGAYRAWAEKNATPSDLSVLLSLGLR
ncbi:MAG TPA: hypothetical protein VM866_09980 [Pyrinomonadaceae bacterium]|nr:hypothetical protein [Pyrinomonadaceae bacterium]